MPSDFPPLALYRLAVAQAGERRACLGGRAATVLVVGCLAAGAAEGGRLALQANGGGVEGL